MTGRLIIVRPLFLLLALQVGLTGCTPMERQFAAAGAGADLMSNETIVATETLESYFGEICRQADLPVVGSRPLRCQTAGFDEFAWSSVVKAGMNDIDHRCDLYLAWLENKRNEKPFIDSTITSLTATTAGVLAVAAPGSDSALKYVSLALGFASQTYNAYYTRALFGLEPSTIKITVEGRRLQFRSEFLDARYRERADAVYVLRSYLKICTPQTITMDVNNYARSAVTGRVPPQVTNLVLERQAIGTLRAPADPAIIKPRPPPKVSSAVGEAFVGAGYSDAQLGLLRRHLCVRSPDRSNSETMAAIKQWEASVYASPDNANRNGRVDDREWTGVGIQRGIRDLGECSRRWRDVGERLLFQDSPDTEAQFVRALQRVKVLAEGQSLDDKSVRDAVAVARQKCGLTATDGSVSSLVSDDLFNKVLEWATKPEGSPCA